ncbi:hypothetical protein [Ottowia beijingensis]|nr:hypothetical protein [Ottowia beijingensis]
MKIYLKMNSGERKQLLNLLDYQEFSDTACVSGLGRDGGASP